MQGSALPSECPHGLRPGTTVCLRCRQEERAAARKRRYLMAARIGAVGIVGAAVIALVVGGVMSVAPGGGGEPRASGDVSGNVAEAAVKPNQPAPGAQAGLAILAPVIAEGRRELGDSMYAMRDGPEVTVHFDVENLRTRFDWKFEGIVRSTLPLLFGPDVHVAMDSIPAGTWVRGGALLVDLPTAGIPLKVGNHTVRVWPVTRQGRDGPLVVGYRASAER